MAAKETANVQPKEAVFSKKELIEAADVFNTTPALMTGALYSVEKETLTREEAADALAAFLKKPVHKGGK